MSIRIIAFGMVIILIALFLALKLLENKLRQQSKEEASYAEIVFRYQEKPSEDSLKLCIKEVAHLLSIEFDQAKKRLISDGVVPKNEVN